MTVLSEHDARIKEQDTRLAKQDNILEKSNVILVTLKNAHCEHLRWTRATHRIMVIAISGGMGMMLLQIVLRQTIWCNFDETRYS